MKESKENWGVIVGTDNGIEWCLPWWWKYYQKHNSLPVTFFDFGMTEKARAWCEKRGDVISFILDENIIKKREAIDPKLVAKWEEYAKKGWIPDINRTFKG